MAENWLIRQHSMCGSADLKIRTPQIHFFRMGESVIVPITTVTIYVVATLFSHLVIIVSAFVFS